MNLPLRLAYDDAPTRDDHAKVAAWFVVGHSADDWTAELADWDAPAAATARLWVVPTSATDGAPCGVLVVGAAPSSRSRSPRSMPYVVRARRLYVPADARLEPEPSDAELAALLDDAGDGLVWHPQAGLVRLRDDAALHIADLIAAPPPAGGLWRTAVSGTALNGRLASIEPDFIPSATDVLSSGRGDIGTEPITLDKLPEAPGETPAGLVGDVSRALGRGAAAAAQWLAAQFPRGAGAPGWLQAVEQWAARRTQQVSQSLETARHRELHRLMNLLADDPDEGLRFALPMGGDESRGVAPPSDRLGRRNVDFNLRQTGGGGPADVWDVPPDMQRALIERYRKLAAREIALGRHRRAAYIFATLLNDFRAAAATLEDGGHYREAAVLWDERLRQPESAAQCLRRGGLRLEAIALYERLGRREIVGDLYAELEQPADAEAAWRRAVGDLLTADDVLAAARLLEGKLDAVDEAIDRLAAAWPTSRHAQNCLFEAFATAARHARHRRAAELVERPAAELRDPAQTAPLVDVLVKQAADYPEADVQSQAADRARMLVAARLGSTLVDTEASRLVTAVGRLVPDDRLFARDGHRYLQQRRSRRPPPPIATRVTTALRVEHEVQLPFHAWRAVAADDAIICVGVRDRELVVARVDWRSGTVEEPSGEKWMTPPGSDGTVILAADPAGRENLIVHVVHSPPLPHLRWFRSTDRFPTPLAAGPHRGLSQATLAVCRSGSETVHVVEAPSEGTLVAKSFVARAQLGGVTSLDLSQLADVDGPFHYPLPTAMYDGALVVGVGRNLCFARSGAPLRVVETPHAVTQLVAAAPHTRNRLIVAMQSGCLLFQEGQGPAPTAFASESTEPQIALTRGGSILVASSAPSAAIEVYTPRDGRPALTTRLTPSHSPPLAVLATRSFNRFALLYEDARLQICSPP